jgi:hypothetical protein
VPFIGHDYLVHAWCAVRGRLAHLYIIALNEVPSEYELCVSEMSTSVPMLLVLTQ